MRLILNADDFGLTEGVCAGIVACLRSGIVTSTSAMVCSLAARQRLQNWRGELDGRCGIHLQLTDASPLSDPARVRSLLSGGRSFPRFPEAIREFDADHLRLEWKAQVEVFLASGLRPTHLDTHHHVHSIPAVFEIFCEIAGEYDLPARTLSPTMTAEFRARGVSCADKCADWNGPTRQSLLSAIESLWRGPGVESVAELVCHPAYYDSELERASVYGRPRAAELATLCEPGLREVIESIGVELVSAI
jgi:predicted glycoside hydrolase/deacetylase ChbG (UPF0249 family)